MEALEDRRLLSLITWTGGGDGTSWSDPHNWSSYPALPSARDDVQINAPAGVTVVHNSGADQIHSLVSSSPFTLSGGSLDVATTVEVDNTFTISGGTLQNATIERGSGAQGVTFTSSGGTLDGVTADSDLDLAASSGAHADIVNGLTLNHATIYVGNAAGSTYGELYFDTAETLGGTGTVVFGKSTVDNEIDETAYGGGTLTLGPGITVRGSSGSLGGYESSIDNQATISADDSGGLVGGFAYDNCSNPAYS